MSWIPIPIKNKVFQNAAETALTMQNATLENCYVTEVGSLSRTLRLKKLLDLSGSFNTYLEEWRGDLIAVTGGNVYRIDTERKTANNVTSSAVTGSGRCIFAKTEDELLMAAGGKIIRLKKPLTDILSDAAPVSTHVAFTNGYVVAIELRSGRFRHCEVGQYDSWNDLDVFAAEGKPDNLVSCIVTEFGELLLIGSESIEQFDSSANGSTPFFRRWELGQGVYAPYTVVSVDNRVWGLNQRQEYVAFGSQLGSIESADVQSTLEKVDNWVEGWAAPLTLDGHRFLVIQAPLATTPYGTKGLTFLYDYLQKRWSTLYSWDDASALPAKWEGTSIKRIRDKVYVGGEGCVYEMVGHDSTNLGRMLFRSGHIQLRGGNPFRVEEMRMRLQRGDAPVNETRPPVVNIRVNKDNRGFGRSMKKSMGKAGQKNMTIEFGNLGVANTFQFEVEITDDCQVEITNLDMRVTEMR